MGTFNVGDKVRFKDDHKYYQTRHELPNELVVSRVSSEGMVRFFGQRGGAFDWRLEHINQPLKVGDTVVCVQPACNTLIEGQQYEITDVVRGYVHVDHACGGWWPDRFKLAPKDCEDEPSQGINPKDAIGASKPDYQFVPMGPIYKTSGAMQDGAKKYGPFNWREQPVNAQVYINAARRHLDLFEAGEDLADDSGAEHLAHMAACAFILMDAQMNNSLNDDRTNDPAFVEYLKENSK